ncbi:MAG: TRAP transporter TatT component family protein [Polyangiaceae bacterium]
MRKLAAGFLPFALVGLLGLSSTGCIKKILLDGQIASTRKGSTAFNTVSDWEIAYKAASAGIAQMEGMHYLGPYNQDALLMLTRSWSGLAFGFIEDEMEQAQDQYGEDAEMVAYHRQRAVAAYSRAIFYGGKLLEMRNPGFEEARKNAETMQAWLREFDEPEEDIENLFWFAQAWLSRVNLLKDKPEYVAELYVGVEIMKRALELDPTWNYGTIHGVMGAYHARTAMAELDQAKEHFDKAIEISEGRSLLVKVNYAAKFYCAKVDKENYVRLLQEVLDAGDPLPEQRLQNTIAKRRAKRLLAPWRMEICGFPS